MKKLALATFVAMSLGAAAYAQQSNQQSGQQSAQQPRQQTQPRALEPAPRGGDRTEQVSFDTADKNKDGTINRDEGNDIDGFDFSRADTNNDREVSRQEYQTAMATSTRRDDDDREPSASSRSQTGAAGQSGQSASQRERGGDSVGGDRQQRQQTAQVTFETADRDRDGKITRNEARDVQGLNFTSADVNDDESLSRQEFQTAMAGVQPRG
jgi:hypothetical protein